MGIPSGGVAFFDSGIGGLTVLAECKKFFPDRLFYYYGDNENAPYGNRKKETIEKYVLTAFEKLQELAPQAAVVACNTATAVCVEKLRKIYSFPIVGAEPAVFAAAKRGGEIYVLATKATCESVRFRELCRRAAEKYPSARLLPFPCERLAGEIEDHLLDQNYDFSALLPKGYPNAVVLGCTHYVYIAEQIKNFYGCETYDGNTGMANRLRSFVDNSPNPYNGLNCGKLGVTTRNHLDELKVIPQKQPVYFLGSQKTVNERVFEQMFAKCRK